MDKRLDRYKSMKTLAYVSALGGIEIKDIEYGIEDYLVYLSGSWSGHPAPHRTKIYYTSDGKAFTKCHGYRIYLDDAIRV